MSEPAWLDVTDPDRPTPLPAGGPNPMAVTLGLVGDEWNLQLIRQALLGTTRYAAWRRELPISHSVLTARLAWLTRAGVFTRVAYQEHPRREAYELTRRGRGLWPLLVSIWTWEHAWVPAQSGRLPTLVHRSCDAATVPTLTCGSCARPAPAREVRGAFGPSGSWERSVPAAGTRRRSRGDAALQFPTTMALLGNRWSAALLGAAFQGLTRFSELEAAVGAPPTVVADRLRAFCELGVLSTTVHPDRPDWSTYHLTRKGVAFFPVIVAAIGWGERWFRSPEGPSFVFTHTACGAGFRPRLVCGTCDEELKGGELEVVPAG